MNNIKDLLKSIKLQESTISMVLGAIVIVVVAALVINFFARQEGETTPGIETATEETLPAIHVVSEGEDLWRISEIYYDTGNNWTDIAEANNIINPNQIFVGQQLTIPAVAPRLADLQEDLQEEEPTPTETAVVPEEIIEEEEIETDEDTEITRTVDEAAVHVIQSGESLWKIAERYYNSGYNWVDIAGENNIANPNLIEAGNELVIPLVEARRATVEVEEESVQPEAITDVSYTVRKGDNLWNIAVRAYGDGYRWSEIAGENNLDNPDLIYEGDTLSLPR